MSEKLIPELFSVISDEFEKHLSKAGNDRIIFSGKFGKGKSTFLSHFFDEEHTQRLVKKYDCIFIDPVNYSVAGTQDIFRYIKYDILLSLLEKDVSVDGIEFTAKEVWSYYLAYHPDELIKSVITHVSEVGKELGVVIKSIQGLNEKVTAFKNEINNLSEEAQLLRFMKSVEMDQFSVYENDMVTELIRQMLKPEGKTSQNVLVIDNLDRIDPEHIFRILNIFSAHMNYSLNKVSVNKFFFDHVILVCDINNIRNIFFNRYGANVDFTGYIDKFYASDIFHFQNNEQVRKVVARLLKKLPILRPNRDTIEFSNQGVTSYGLVPLVEALIQKNLLTLRPIMNNCSTSITAIDIPIWMGDLEVHKSITEMPALEMFILARLAGGYHSLVKMIEELRENNMSVPHFRTYFDDLLYYHLRHIHHFSTILKGNPATIGTKNVEVTVTQGTNTFNHVQLILHYGQHNQEYSPLVSDFYTLYLAILQDYHLENYIE